MSAPEDFTNADDVIVTIQGNTAGGSGHVVLDSFEYSDENDTQLLSGVGNKAAQGASHGNVTGSFSATAMGEHAELFQSLSPDSNWDAPDCHVTIFGEETRWNIAHWWPSERTFSGSDGETVEYEASGPCIPIREY